MKLPYIKFYPRDWMGEVGLQSLSYDARGLWIDMLCIMASSDRYGYLLNGSEPMDAETLARVTRGDKQTVAKLLKQLLKQKS